VKATKKGSAQPPPKNGGTDPGEFFSADECLAPIDVKTDRKYLRMALWAGLSTVFLAFGSIACGLLSQEENAAKAVVLFLGGLAGAAGCIFFFYCFLREISPKPRPPFISTLQ
jgi:hypothetical protein